MESKARSERGVVVLLLLLLLVLFMLVVLLLRALLLSLEEFRFALVLAVAAVEAVVPLFKTRESLKSKGKT